jgi:hypothetical protein
VREWQDEGAIEREITLARWDWPKPANRPTGAPIINARIDVVADHRDDAAGVGERAHPEPGGQLLDACVDDRGARGPVRRFGPVPAGQGWTGEKGNKQPHFIHAEDDALLAAAGLTWTTEIDGQRRRVFVVVTREARVSAIALELASSSSSSSSRLLLDAALSPSTVREAGLSQSSQISRDRNAGIRSSTGA